MKASAVSKQSRIMIKAVIADSECCSMVEVCGDMILTDLEGKAHSI